ncbi:RNA-guided endonuclease InsQ/TnpB family protein [Crocosphaera watsonii WH 8501]|uniref:Transposase, IS605 OrfB n=4 Tax=Crocosphaera TaxID=263510 RepID=Q4C9B2_CROWT|nr:MULTISPECIES: RNA-guided endonuclease TnpB family protein [Cyanophyceae]EAM53374.1 Transposase, IS605 OrfB [Crocosphaera watsonii WH 8501]MCH2080686.1 transposase [Prochlorococcus sp. ALOHA_ZT_50]
MKYTYQYRILPTTNQKITLNRWLRVCRFWFNRQLGERFQWWEQNRCAVNSCPLICHLPELKEKPNYYSQKKQLPILKKDVVTVQWSKEKLDLSEVPSLTLQEVCKRVDKAFSRYISGDSNGKRSGKPRFKSSNRFRSMVFEGGGLSIHSCSVGKKYLYLKTPKIGLIKVRMHRYLPDGAILKQAQIIKKADGWYVNLRLDDPTIPKFNKDKIVANWDNSTGLDAVLYEDDYLATSDGKKLSSLKSLRKSEARLAQISQRKANKKKGSKSRRKLAKRESREHQRIARARKDHAYSTAHKLLKTGKKVFFHEKLNLKGLSRKNKPVQDDNGKYLPNGQSAKSGLNKSWSDAAFGQFFSIFNYIAEKAGVAVIEINPAYTSQLLPYRDEFVFTDCSIREYWDEIEQVSVDRDISAAINIKRVGLDEFPTIKRRKGKIVIVDSTTHLTSKEVLSVFRGLEKPAL